MPADPAALLELVEPARWQRLQDHFASVLGILLRTISPAHQLLVTPSWPTGMPIEPIIKRLRVGEELEQLLPTREPLREVTSLTSPLGVSYSAVPIRTTAEDVIAYFVLGPVVVGAREEELQFRRRVSAMGLQAEALWPLMLSLKLYSFAGIRSVLSLLEEVATSLVQFAYQAGQLSAILPPSARVDQAALQYHTNRVLQSLLEAAILATKAEGGSVMVRDPQQGALVIRAAHGLDEEIIRQTRVKRGEGLAGLVAAEGSLLLLDAQTTDPRLTERMARRHLASSLVAPLSTDAEPEPFGVLNLRTTNRQRPFGPEQVALLRRLLELAGAALGGLRAALDASQPAASSEP